MCQCKEREKDNREGNKPGKGGVGLPPHNLQGDWVSLAPAAPKQQWCSGLHGTPAAGQREGTLQGQEAAASSFSPSAAFLG